MTHANLPLWADAVRTTFEWGRIQSNADWIAPVAVCIAILLFVRWLYRRDAQELRPLWGWLLTALRTAAFLGLLVVFLQPHWRSEREEVRNSRVLLLADTSLSMGLTDAEPAGPQNNSRGLTAPGKIAPGTCAGQLAAALKESDLLTRLRKTHDVSVFEFAEDLKRDGVVTLNKYTPDDPTVRGDSSRRLSGEIPADRRLESPPTTDLGPIGPSCWPRPGRKRGSARPCGS